MTQVFTEEGKAVPVTVVQAGPCSVLQIKTQDRDGYQAVQLGFKDKRRPSGSVRSAGSQARKSERGHVAAINSKRSAARKARGIDLLPKPECEPKRFIRELRGETEGYEVGQEIGVSSLADVKKVDVVATSRGRGFSGVMKRHNFSGQRATHGVKKCHRHAGGTGMSASPSRLFKGVRMAGQYGNTRTTVRNLEIVGIDEEKQVLLVRGAIPGPNGGYVVVSETNMKK
ncbi:MAG: 50S ribosomal protein L3 [Pirellulaceae bacterium]|nr:50S ribosomal protein L3 [Pirellulaceae bacterium]